MLAALDARKPLIVNQNSGRPESAESLGEFQPGPRSAISNQRIHRDSLGAPSPATPIHSSPFNSSFDYALLGILEELEGVLVGKKRK